MLRPPVRVVLQYPPLHFQHRPRAAYQQANVVCFVVHAGTVGYPGRYGS